MRPTTAQQLWGPSASFLHHSEDAAEIKSFYSRAQESSQDFILKEVICKERSSVTEGEMARAEHKMATRILILTKFCSFITFCIEYVCSNMALVAASVHSFFSILLYSFQIIPSVLKVKPEKISLISYKNISVYQTFPLTVYLGQQVPHMQDSDQVTAQNLSV